MWRKRGLLRIGSGLSSRCRGWLRMRIWQGKIHRKRLSRVHMLSKLLNPFSKSQKTTSFKTYKTPVTPFPKVPQTYLPLWFPSAKPENSVPPIQGVLTQNWILNLKIHQYLRFIRAPDRLWRKNLTRIKIIISWYSRLISMSEHTGSLLKTLTRWLKNRVKRILKLKPNRLNMRFWHSLITDAGSAASTHPQI